LDFYKVILKVCDIYWLYKLKNLFYKNPIVSSLFQLISVMGTITWYW